MSWMRYPLYVWSDGETVSLSIGAFGKSLQIPEAELEDLAVMVAAGLLEEGRLVEVANRAADRHTGNVGCDPLDALLGRPRGFADTIAARVEELKNRE